METYDVHQHFGQSLNRATPTPALLGCISQQLLTMDIVIIYGHLQGGIAKIIGHIEIRALVNQ